MGQVKANGKPDVEGWLEQVTKQQHVDIDVYMMDAVWPSVALKKLVGDNIPITEEDLKKGYEANYGPRAQCRAIILSNQRKARKCGRKLATIRRWNISPRWPGNTPATRAAVRWGARFRRSKGTAASRCWKPRRSRSKPNELSSVIQVGENFIILYCEGYSKPIEIDMAEARKYIEEDLREKKIRIAMHKEYGRLQEICTIDNYLAGTMKSPAPRRPSARRTAMDLPPSMSNMPAARAAANAPLS